MLCIWWLKLSFTGRKSKALSPERRAQDTARRLGFREVNILLGSQGGWGSTCSLYTKPGRKPPFKRSQAALFAVVFTRKANLMNSEDFLPRMMYIRRSWGNAGLSWTPGQKSPSGWHTGSLRRGDLLSGAAFHTTVFTHTPSFVPTVIPSLWHRWMKKNIE